jgi:predicted nuclease of restriction endonuclease-like (RecB) superfamily
VTDLALPEDYASVFAAVKQRVREARYRAQRQVNTELIRMNWQIGRLLVEQSERAQWGDKVRERLSMDLRAEFSGVTGFSLRNLKYMRSFAREWPGLGELGQQPVAQLPWGHITVLLDKIADNRHRDWYAAQAVPHGWSRAVLEHHVKTVAHQRLGAAPTNFERLLEPGASDLAQQITKDQYVFDFLAVEPGYVERELEAALVERIIDTLGELGSGFSFVGRQVPMEVDGDEFFVDLLFFHIEQLRYVVVELKVGKFKPEYAGQLGFYVELVEKQLRRRQHAATVGLLLCTDKNDRVVRYALATSTHPMAVASYDLLPPAERAALPSEADLERAFELG